MRRRFTRVAPSFAFFLQGVGAVQIARISSSLDPINSGRVANQGRAGTFAALEHAFLKSE